MRAYILNLDTAEGRWKSLSEQFKLLNFPLTRVPAVDGTKLQLPTSDYAEARYRLFHGRPTNLREIGCYLSHLAACRAFLETNDTHGLICEDDLVLGKDFLEVLAKAMEVRRSWNILRLSGLGSGAARPVHPLVAGYSICINFGRLKGAGAYILDRRSAETFARRLHPMWLPYDHAFDREWFFGLKAASVQPFPISQVASGFRSSIQIESRSPYPASQRWFTTYPYQAANEVSRLIFRGLSFLFWKIGRQAEPNSTPRNF
ncbi:MAG: glycosyltransferase family 25 protein [Chthoniobacterales bacterium]|nr:glycosyltransferase family 25 protein [Chthoniobacterales bacterium]